MKKVTIFDTSVASLNIGDSIIVDSVSHKLSEIFSANSFFFKIPTHEIIGYQSHKILKQSDYAFVAGTNLLNSNRWLLLPNSWKFGFTDALMLDTSKIVLMGVGWGEYQKAPKPLAKLFYHKVLSKTFLHSVRDNYTKEMLINAGVKNVINTGCATMWNLTPEFCSRIPHDKSDCVVFTLTDYRQDSQRDQRLIDILENNYSDVYFWPQGSQDYAYFSTLKNRKVQIINAHLASFDQILSTDIDYVGTRLHGGIRALQHGKRTIIIGIDNRALEKKSDFNLQVIHGQDIDTLEDVINSSFATDIRIDTDAIRTWMEQFVK